MSDLDDLKNESTNVVELCEATNPAEASAIQATLQDAGIQAEVVGNLAGNAFDLPMNVSALQVLVHARDVERAREILAEVRRHHDDTPIDEERNRFEE